MPAYCKCYKCGYYGVTNISFIWGGSAWKCFCILCLCLGVVSCVLCFGCDDYKGINSIKL